MQPRTFSLEKLQTLLRQKYSHNLAERSRTDSVLLNVRIDGVEGWGEATPREYVTGESSSGVIAEAQSFLPGVLAKLEPSLISIQRLLDTVPDETPALRGLIEGAFLDWLARQQGKSQFQTLDCEKPRTLTYTANLTGGSAEAFESALARFAAARFTQVKFKLTGDGAENLRRLRRIRETLGERVKVRADGNEIWKLSQARDEMPKLIAEGLTSLEQPFARADWDAYAYVQRTWGGECELLLDESITTKRSLVDALKRDCFGGAVLKISKNGGILRALELARELKAHGKSVHLGCHVGETSLLTLAGMLFALRFPEVGECEGAYGDFVLETDPFKPCLKFGVGGRLEITSEMLTHFSLHKE